MTSKDTSIGTHSPIDYSDQSKIISEVADAYEEWRGQYGAPRSRAATLQMVEDILTPLLERLASWSAHEGTASAAIEDIKNLIAQREILR